jgi:hypothetical protein
MLHYHFTLRNGSKLLVGIRRIPPIAADPSGFYKASLQQGVCAISS